jgi:hypothetical protein
MLDHKRPVECPACDKTFPTQSELRRHQECKHNSPIKRKSTIRRRLKNVHHITKDLDSWIEEEDNVTLGGTKPRSKTSQNQEPEEDGSSHGGMSPFSLIEKPASKYKPF